MYVITNQQLELVTGGEGKVDSSIGTAAGYVLHAMKQPSVQIAGMLSPAAAVVAAIVHFNGPDHKGK